MAQIFNMLSEFVITKLIVIILTIIGFLSVNWIRGIKNNLIAQIENQSYKLNEKFVLKTDYNSDRVEILEILRRIEDKLDRKQDKVK